MTNKLNLDPEIFSDKQATVNGVLLHYVVGGDGPLLLLLHGFLATWASWRKVMPELAKSYTVIAPDMRGFGDSDKPEKDYDAETLAKDFRAIIKHESDQQQVIIMAHDMGAPPALLYAGTHPDEVFALVYIENPVLTMENMHALHQFTPEGTKNGGLWWWSFAFATDIPKRLLLGHEHNFLTWFYRNATHDKGASIEEEAVSEYLRTFEGTEGINGAFGIYREVFESIKQTERHEGIVSKVSTPILALGGELSLGHLVELMLNRVASNVRGEIIPQCGHFVPEEKPHQLLKIFRTFITNLPSK